MTVQIQLFSTNQFNRGGLGSFYCFAYLLGILFHSFQLENWINDFILSGVERMYAFYLSEDLRKYVLSTQFIYIVMRMITILSMIFNLYWKDALVGVIIVIASVYN